jgi:O-antigen/teichoic acid export membrane protein
LIGRKIALAVTASWLNQAIRIGLNIVILPIMFRFMGKEELGIWLILGQTGVILSLMTEGGLTSTITRRIAFAAGKSSLALTGSIQEESRHELANLLASGVIAYRLFSMGVFAIAFLLGSFYLWQLSLHELSSTTVWAAWVLMCFGYAATIWSGLWTALVMGLGYVATGTTISTAFMVATLLAQMFVVLAGGGLLWLSAVPVVSGIAVRFAVRVYIRRRQPGLFETRGRWDPNLLRGMVGPSIKSWLTAMGIVLLFKTDQYFIALYVDTTQLPAYYAAYTMLHNLAILALTMGVTSGVYVSQLWQAGAMEAVHDIVLRSVRVSLILMAYGAATLLVVGKDLIGIWVGPGNFVGYPVLATLCLTFVLCVQQGAVLTLARATEHEVYAVPSLLAGGLNLVLAWVLVRHMGLLGVAMATLLAQLLTTNWWIVYDGLRRLRIPRATYLRSCVVPVIAGLLATFVATTATTQDRLLLSTAFDRALAGVVVAGCICLSSLWLFGLSAANRQQIRSKVRIGLRGLVRARRTTPPLHPG